MTRATEPDHIRRARKRAREHSQRNGKAPRRAPPVEEYPEERRGDAWESPAKAEPPEDSEAEIALDAPLWPKLSDEALHGLPGDIVRVIEPTTEADPVAILGQTLVAFGSIIGRTAHFRAEEDVHYLNEFLVLVGRTSKGRKGASWGRVRRIVETADPDWLSYRVLGGLSSGEGLIESVRDAVRDKKGNIVAEAVGDKRVLAYEGEFACVLKQIERQGNTLSVTLRQAWDGVRLRTLTRNNPLCATDAHVALIGNCTGSELTRLLSATETANGFGNRILWLCVRRSKTLPDGAALDPRELAPLQQRFKAAVDFGRLAGTMHRTEEARALWHEVYGPLSEGKPGLAGSLLARAEAHVMRLACLYALMDHFAKVDVDHLKAALALWKYVEASVRYVWGDSLGDPVADEILRALRSASGGLTRTQIRDLFSRNRSTEEIGRALAALNEYGLARNERHETRGRAAEVWVAC
jgi:hypothetical protein